PLGDQHRSERDRQNEDRRQDSLPRAVAPHAESDRQRKADIDEGCRDRDPEGRRDRVVEKRLREEAEIVGEPAALLRLEREDEPVEKRIDKEQQHDEYPRQREERGPVELTLGHGHPRLSRGKTRTRSGATAQRADAPA